MNQVQIRVDRDADAAYIRLSNERVARTIEVNEDVLVDLDANGIAVGVEMLSLDAQIPFTKLKKHVHLHSEVIDHVRRIRPSINDFFRLQVGWDSKHKARDAAPQIRVSAISMANA